jgi:hypothetical protein
MHRTRSIRAPWIAALCALILIAPAVEAQTKVQSGFNLFSPEQDVEIGSRSASDAERQLPMVQNARVQDYVSGIGERLAAQASGPRFNYRFRVVNASDLNAFALPGGYIYLNRGILEAAKNEGEVAGVLAHEIAHVALRHGTHNASKAHLTQAGIGLLGGLLGGKVGGGSNTTQIINAIGGFGLNVLFLKYTREAEKDADLLGAQILARSGYNPQDMVSFFQTLAKTDKRRRPPTWLSSHPSPENRIERIQNEARLLGVTPSATTRNTGLASVQSVLQSLGPAASTEQIARGQTTPTRQGTPTRGAQTVRVDPPSGQMRTHTNRAGVYQLQYPANWRVYESGSTGVTIAPEGGAFERNGRAVIVYGAIVNHYEPFRNDVRSRQTSTVEAATEDLIQQISRSSGHLRLVRGSARRFRLAGGTALGATLTGTSPETGLQERVTVVTRPLADQHLLYMLFVTPERDARAYTPVLNAMVESMRVDPDRRH